MAAYGGAEMTNAQANAAASQAVGQYISLWLPSWPNYSDSLRRGANTA